MKLCKFCQNSIEHLRSDALYCNSGCYDKDKDRYVGESKEEYLKRKTLSRGKGLEK